MKLPLLVGGCACMTLSLAAQEVEAGLYRPAAKALVMSYAPAKVEVNQPLKPLLYLRGRSFPAGKGGLDYQLLSGKRVLHQGKLDLDSPGELFERTVPLADPAPGADRVEWAYRSQGKVLKGSSPLRWSRLRGRVEYVDGPMRPCSITLHPCGFSPAVFTVPVDAEGRFDAELPARTYAVVNVNSAGYAVDALERWAWAYDLNRDREEVFRIGRTELYAMHAFDITGGPTTVFVTFRPSALTRSLRHVADPKEGPKSPAMMAVLMEHMRINPMALAPDLKMEDVKLWVDGQPMPISDLSHIVETTYEGFRQTQYILQFTPARRLTPGVRHEIKVEVVSKDILNGQIITDFGQGSVGFMPEL